MNWLADNLAVLSGVLVPILLGVIGPLTSRESGGREYRRVRRYAQLRSLLPDEGAATSKMDALLDAEVERFTRRVLARSARKLDGGNLATIVVVSVVGGLISFGLVTWAQASSGLLALVVWVVFAGWTVFLLLLVFIGGLSSLYQADVSAEKS